MPVSKTLKVALGIAALFTGLAGTIIVLMVTRVVSIQVALLMLVALLGIYVGFGILILAYRLISKLE
jgi:hypothetical protein